METFTLVVWLAGTMPSAVIADLSKEECAHMAQAAWRGSPPAARPTACPASDPFVIRPNPR